MYRILVAKLTFVNQTGTIRDKEARRIQFSNFVDCAPGLFKLVTVYLFLGGGV